MSVVERALAWDGCVNVRDLGGYATEDGRTTRVGAVVRADNVRRLTDAGWEALLAHGIRTVLDLRWREELAEDPPRELSVDVVHVSLFGEADPEYGRELDERALRAVTHADFVRSMYVAALERNRERFGEAVRAVARAREGGVLVHCYAGKDRTGLVSALLLRFAGVSADDVVADYAASERNMGRLFDDWIANAPDDDERERRAKHRLTPPEAMRGVLEYLDARYGGVRSYLRAAGISDDDLERVRARLVEDR